MIEVKIWKIIPKFMEEFKQGEVVSTLICDRPSFSWTMHIQVEEDLSSMSLVSISLPLGYWSDLVIIYLY